MIEAERAASGGEAGAAAPPWYGVALYHLLPIRRATIRANLQRVFGARLSPAALRRLAQAHYAHLARSLVEVACEPFASPAARAAGVRVENLEACLRAGAAGRGLILLTAHLGNWEVACTRAVAQLSRYHGRFHVLRRPLPWAWLDRLVARRFARAGVGVLAKRGTLDRLLALLAANDVVIFLFDQFAAGRDGVVVDFLGSPAATFRSLAILARATGAAVVPTATWRDDRGCHVVRFAEALRPIDCADPDEWIRRTTRAYNAALEPFILAHPAQWFWAHRRWKCAAGPSPGGVGAGGTPSP